MTGVIIGEPWSDEMGSIRIDARFSNGARLALLDGADQVQKV